MKMFNYEVQFFLDFLMKEMLSGKKNRMRTKFVKMAAIKLQEIENDKVELIKEYAEKDANGELVIIIDEETGQQMYKVPDMQGFNREENILMNELFVIDETEERQDMLETIKDIVLNTESAFSGEDAFRYDRFCDIVENE